MDELKINEDFAKKYNKYREKEELQKLKSRYGDVDAVENSSDSESEDENAAALTPGLERDFLRTLSYLKKKDPVIYDKTKTFYEEPESDESASSIENNKQKASKPMFLKDYERKVILEKEGKFIEDESDDDEEQQTKEASPSYHQEQMKLKEDIKKALKKVKDEEDISLLTKRTKSPNEKEKEEEEFRKWLKTPDAQLDITEKSENATSSSKMLLAVAEEVAPLKQYWTDPNLDEGETFLRDYILERKYMDPNADGETPTYDEIIGVKSGSEIGDSEDELFEKKSERFEHKYNFRFEEPDQELIKSFPRTIGASVRRKEDIRKKKREEKKKKDEEKKRKKQEELKQLKALKKKEILAKIKRLQETTGNKDMAFSEADLEVDFDPEQYDKRMQEIFSNYDEDFDGEKPVISDVEDEMEDYEKYWDDELEYAGGEHEADCDNPDFIMDCDYDPAEHQRQKEQQKSRKNLRPIATEKDKKMKKSPFFDSVAKPKPTFDPSEKSFEKYLDEYYALDYEDLIGDLPCRFKYRQVVPNDFGLSTDEVLSATDKELNAWCSLKSTVQYRKEEDERRDVKKYQRKSKDIWKKARILKTVYKMPGEDEEIKSDNVENRQEGDGVPRKTKMNSRKRRRLKERTQKLKLLEEDIPGTSLQHNGGLLGTESRNAQQHKKFKNVFERPEAEKKSSIYITRKKRDDPFNKVSKLSDDRLKAYGLQPKKFLKKMKYGTANTGL